ncbi:hypothetical protein FB451DRAFT_1564097 [Mycena latifolia]|nr:hypothetical protein FB451DRAFT_1564097 [Mycena latifolia]
MTALVFLVPLSDYDWMLCEDESVVCLPFLLILLCAMGGEGGNATSKSGARLRLAVFAPQPLCPLLPSLSLRVARPAPGSLQGWWTGPEPHARGDDALQLDLQLVSLNKIDLFVEKLPALVNVPSCYAFLRTSAALLLRLSFCVVPTFRGDYFPEYTGGGNYDAPCDYLLHRVVLLNQSATTKQIYAHYMSATDTQQTKSACPFFSPHSYGLRRHTIVPSTIQDIVLQLHLRECGLL